LLYPILFAALQEQYMKESQKQETLFACQEMVDAVLISG